MPCGGKGETTGCTLPAALQHCGGTGHARTAEGGERHDRMHGGGAHVGDAQQGALAVQEAQVPGGALRGAS